MNTASTAALASFCLAVTSFAQEMSAPKPLPGRACRILLYIKGSDRVLDYHDVIKVHAAEPNAVTFETTDGFIVVHQGAFTLIGPKTEFADHTRAGRVRFFDPK
jgi:hypothetical protein